MEYKIMTIQTIIKNIEFEINLYKNNDAITKELNELKNTLDKMIAPTQNEINFLLNANIAVYDVLLQDKYENITAKQKKTYNFMLNFLISNR
jgi:hypothetical protein